MRSYKPFILTMETQHVKCLLWKTLWSIAALCLFAAWFSYDSGRLFGLETELWFWNSLIFGVLSVSIKFDCQSCRMCSNGSRKK